MESLKLPKRSAADSRAYRNTEFHRNYYTHRQETQADFSQGIDTDVDTIMNYDASAEITDKYKEEIDGDELELGQIMETTYRTDDARVVSMKVPDDAWEYSDVDKFTFDTEECSMEVAGELYQYSEQTYFGSIDDKKIDMLELSDKDKLTVRGVGYKVYSVVRTEGHGYIHLLNYSDFLGGMINIDDDIILPVTKNMLITVSCGTYRITISKGAAKQVRLSR